MNTQNNNSDRQAASKHDGLVAFPSSVSSPTSSPSLVSLPTSSVECTTTQQRETPKAAAAFSTYCLLGIDRSLAKLKEHLDQIKPKSSPNLATLKNWSSQFHWQDRVRAYDAQEAEKRRKKRQQELERMDERHATMGQLNAMVATNRINELMQSHDINAQAAVSLLRVAAELERLARGAATSRLEGDITVLVQPKEYIGISEDEEGSVE